MRDTRAWRRIRIATMYAGYAALYAEILVHQEVGRSWPAWAQATLGLVFGLTAITIILTWGWLLSGAVRYGLGPAQRRRTSLAEMRALKARSYTASEARALLVSHPDERQQAIRHRAQSVAYQVFGIVVIVGAAYGVFAGTIVDRHLWLPRTSSEFTAIAMALFLLYSTLPPAVVAWTEPDAPPEDSRA